jgi:TonB family protein
MSFAQRNESAFPVSSKKLTQDFINAAMQYPQEALHQGISGKVTVGFKINIEGYPYDYQVIQSIHPLLDHEAIRLVSKIIFNPAKSNGNPIIEEQQMTIAFKPKLYQRIVSERGYEIIPSFYQNADTSGKVFNFADLNKHPQPILPNEKGSLAQYVQQKLQYPEAAALAGITGTVGLNFVIETDGIVSNISIKNSVGGGCDNEAIRILQSLRWKPGAIGEMAVRCNAFLEVTFKLENSRQMAIPNRQSSGL